MVRLLSGTPKVSVGDIDICSVDYTDYLDSGELLSGTPTVVEITTSDLSFANVGLNTAAVTILGRSVAISAAVLFKVSGGTTANSPYRIRVTASTDSTPSRTVIRDLLLTYE